MLVVSGREFVGVSRRFEDGDRNQNIVMYSVDHPKKPVEPSSKTIRGDILIGGWHFVKKGPNLTKVVNYMVPFQNLTAVDQRLQGQYSKVRAKHGRPHSSWSVQEYD